MSDGGWAEGDLLGSRIRTTRGQIEHSHRPERRCPVRTLTKTLDASAIRRGRATLHDPHSETDNAPDFDRVARSVGHHGGDCRYLPDAFRRRRLSLNGCGAWSGFCRSFCSMPPSSISSSACTETSGVSRPSRISTTYFARRPCLRSRCLRSTTCWWRRISTERSFSARSRSCCIGFCRCFSWAACGSSTVTSTMRERSSA